MEKKSKITAMLSVLLVSAPTTAKKITTSNLRDNAMRTTAIEVDEANIDNIEAEASKNQKESDIVILDANKLKFDFNSATIKEEYTPVLEKLKNYIESKNYKVSNETIHFMASFYRFSFAGVIFDWIEKGMHENPQKIVDQVAILMQGTFASALERFEKAKK